MQATGRGAKLNDASLGVFGVLRDTVPHAGAAVDAFLAVEDGDAVPAGRDRLTRADFDTNLRPAPLAKIGVEEHNVVSIAGGRLHFTPDQ
jgi:hypothetical protein